MFKLNPRDYSVYWHVMVSPSRNPCVHTGWERDSPTLHLAGDAYSEIYMSCCFLGLLIHRTKSFTDKKDLKWYFWQCPCSGPENRTHCCPVYFYRTVQNILDNKLGSDSCPSVSSSCSILLVQQLPFFITGFWQRNCIKFIYNKKHSAKKNPNKNNLFTFLFVNQNQVIKKSIP